MEIIVIADVAINSALSLIPFRSVCRIFRPEDTNNGSRVVRLFTMSGITPETASTMLGRISVRAFRIVETEFTKAGRMALTNSPSFGMNNGAAFEIKSAIPFNAVVIRGISRLTSPPPLSSPNNAVIRPLSASCRFPPPAIAVSTFSQEALVALAAPVIVCSASCAVVPVIPISTWITWIASYTSERLLMSYFTPVRA